MPTDEKGPKQERPMRVSSLETLKNKCKLKECERKYYAENVGKQISHNVNVIRKLRTDNKEQHRHLADSIHAEEQVIKEVFQDRKRDYLSLKRFTADKIVENIDDKTCDVAKIHNVIQHERKAREERLAALKTELQRLKKTENKTSSELSMEQRAHVIENNLDKVHMKMNTARQLSEKYGEIIKKIEDQNRAYPSKLEDLQEQLIERKADLKELKVGKDTAVQAKELASQDLNEAQKDFSKKRKQREHILSETRKKIEESQARRDHFAEKIQKGRQIHKIPSHYRNTRLSAIESFQMKLLTAQDAFRILRQNTAIVEIADFIERFENQDEVRWRLSEQAENVRKQHEQLKKEKNDLWEEYTTLKYNGMTYISDGERALDDKVLEISNKEQEKQNLSDDLHKQGEVLTGVKEALHALLKKISKYFSEQWFASHSLTDDIQFFSEKIEQIVYEVSMHEDEYDRAVQKLKTDEDALHMMTSINNIRVRLIPSTESTDSFHYDHHESDNVPTRDDIKNNGMHMMELRHRKPKKSKKAK